jgi:pimeloyl-ACP methyl ester carboxylesterase
MAAFLLKRLAATPFVVQDAGGVRLVLPAGIRSRKELELLGAQYELGLRALPEYRPYCELLFAVVGGILDGVRPQAEHMAAAHALLAGMLGAPSKLDFLGRLAGELCFAGRFEGRERLSVLLLGAGGLEPLAALVEAAPGAHIEARVVSGWPQVAQALAERGRERFPGVRFVASAPLVPGALAQRLEGSRFDAVVVHTQDPCAHEAAALLAQRAEAGVGDPLVLMVEGIESRGLHLVLELTGLWPRIAAQHALPDAAALAEALERAGYRRQTLAASLLSVFSLEPEDGGDGGGDGSEDAQREDIDSFLRQTFADAVDDGTALDPAADLAEAGLSSMSWTLVYARLEQRFGEAVDAGLFGTEEGPLSVDTLAARLWQRLRVSRPVAPLPQDLADRVGQRLVAVSRMEVALEHAARLRRHEITSRRGQRWEVYEGGSGPALIFLTAMAFGMPVWENQIRALAPGYRLVFPHLPGHAGSVCTGKGFSFENLADDLVELMDALGIGQAHLVGWCMAGNIAQLVALRHPRRLKSLTLVCTTPTDARMRGLSQKDLEEYAESPLLTYQMEFSNIYQGELLAPEVSRSMATIKASHVPVDPHAMLSFVGSLFKFDTRERLRQIGLPTLVIAGRRDIAFPVEQVALLAQGIPQARLVIFERGGHLPFLNQSEAFNETLRTFLADAASVRSGGARRHEPAPPDAGETREVVC